MMSVDNEIDGNAGPAGTVADSIENKSVFVRVSFLCIVHIDDMNLQDSTSKRGKSHHGVQQVLVGPDDRAIHLKFDHCRSLIDRS